MKFLSACVIAIFLVLPSMAVAQKKPTPVFVAVVERVPFVDEVEALGTLQANENVELTSTVTERITKIHFSDNQRVKRGDILLEMDASEEQAEMAEEQFRIDEAQRQVNRLRALAAKDAVSKSALDVQERELQTAQARINAITSRLNERRITAPFDGVVGLRNVSVGTLAQPGTLITTIDDDSVMKLDFSVPEIFLATLASGINVVATASAFPDQIFTGTVTGIDSRIDPVTRSVVARALLNNDKGQLKAGMLMRVVLKKNPRETLVIPEESVIVSGAQNSVMVVYSEDGQQKVRRQSIEIGARRKGEVEVLEGLAEGEQIVTHGTLRLRPGAPVDVKALDTDNAALTDLLRGTRQEAR